MQRNNAAILQSGNLFMFVMHNPVRYVDPTGLFAIIPNFPNLLGPVGGGFGQGFVTSIMNQVTSNLVLLASGNKKEMLAYGVDGKGVGHKAPSPAPSTGGHVSGGGGGTIGGGSGAGSSTVTTPHKVTLPKPVVPPKPAAPVSSKKPVTAHLTPQQMNQFKNSVLNGNDVHFNSMQDALDFINRKFPDFNQEVAGSRSAQGWHFDYHSISGSLNDINHINIYSKSYGFRVHITWEN